MYAFFDIENHKIKETTKLIVKNLIDVYLLPTIQIIFHNFPL